MSSQITFTELENKVLEAIRSLIADGYELIYMGDLQYCGLDLKKARGAMASLVKKNAIYVDRDSDGLISLLSAGELPAIEKEVIGEEGASQLVSRVEGVIVAFHSGRGGRFNNPGYVKFIGLNKISNYTDDLFIGYTNQDEVSAIIGERDRQQDLLQQAIDCGCSSNADNDAYVRLKKLGLDLGELEYYEGASRSMVGLTLTEAGTGVGSIDIDGQYNTTTCMLLTDCSEENCHIIRKSSEWDFLSNDIQDYIRYIIGEQPEICEEN